MIDQGFIGHCFNCWPQPDILAIPVDTAKTLLVIRLDQLVQRELIQADPPICPKNRWPWRAAKFKGSMIGWTSGKARVDEAMVKVDDQRWLAYGDEHHMSTIISSWVEAHLKNQETNPSRTTATDRIVGLRSGSEAGASAVDSMNREQQWRRFFIKLVRQWIMVNHHGWWTVSDLYA